MFVPHRCDDDEHCCESDEGEVRCCAELGVVGYVLKSEFAATVTLLIFQQL